jgi:hypothetical protein
MAREDNPEIEERIVPVSGLVRMFLREGAW